MVVVILVPCAVEGIAWCTTEIILWINLCETVGGFVGIGIGKQGRTNTLVLMEGRLSYEWRYCLSFR